MTGVTVNDTGICHSMHCAVTHPWSCISVVSSLVHAGRHDENIIAAAAAAAAADGTAMSATPGEL
jgi:hypothetical protein